MRGWLHLRRGDRMDILRVVLLVVHIISAGLWISEEVIGVVLSRMIHTHKGKPTELTLATLAMTLFGIMGPLATVGILVTGIGMTLHSGWALLGIGSYTPPWLALKQVIYLVMLAYVMVILRPKAEQLMKSFATSTASGILNDEGRALLSQFWVIGTIHSLIVLVNIVLAVWKPALGG